MVEKNEPLLTADTAWRRVLDVDTGEVSFIVPVTDTDAGLPRARKPKPRRHSSPYATIYREGALLIARSRDITGGDHRVLMALLALAPIDRAIFRVSHRDVAEITGISESNISGSLKRLIDVGILHRPRHGWVRFEPRYVWRGPVDSREEALAEKIASAQGAEGSFAVHTVVDA